MNECTCTPEHSVTKLGHCRDCPAYRTDQPTMVEYELLVGGGCPPRHRDSTPHDFHWATYEDETLGTGVCRCGLRAIDVDLMILP